MYSLIRKRTDLPEMSLPLWILSVLLSAAAAWMGAQVAVSPAGGPVISLVFFTLSASIYCAVITLWRKISALLVTPVTALLLWFSDCGLFCTAAVTLSLLFVSWIAGVCLLSGETRFMRMTSLSCGIAVTLGLCTLAGFSLYYPSLSVLYDEVLLVVNAIVRQIPETTGIQLDAGAVSDLVRTVFLSLPALLGVMAEFLAASLILLCRAFMRILGCDEAFRSASDDGITTPRSFGGILLITLVLTLFTSPYDNPLLYCILSNILSVIVLPCAYVGIREFFGRMQRRFIIYRPGVAAEQPRPFPISAILLFFLLTFLIGVSGALFLTASMGATYILRAGKNGKSTPEHPSGS